MTALRERALISLASVPALPKHVRIQYDPVRQAFAVLSPEKVFWPNDISLDILRHCDGHATVEKIIAALATEYNADASDVSDDVTAFLQEWSDKLLVTL
ncbi:pyrroloquinoline quinone biosynthesis peptide chaperone PqqD [Mesorhizobium sp. A623]